MLFNQRLVQEVQTQTEIKGNLAWGGSAPGRV